MVVASHVSPGAPEDDPPEPANAARDAAGGPVQQAAGTVAQLVGRTLAELGVGHVFGVVGSGNFEVTNALRLAGVPFTAARHEGGAATMADAYARMSGRVGVVSTHQGCGLSNAVTGIGEAAKSRTPLIVLTADTQASAVRSNFKIDQDALARSVGAVERADPFPGHRRRGHPPGLPHGPERTPHRGAEPAPRRPVRAGPCRARPRQRTRPSSPTPSRSAPPPPASGAWRT